MKEEIDVMKEEIEEKAAEQTPEEILARKQGWTPKEEFNGDPEKWVDAEVFIERGKEINSILRKNNERLESKLDNMEKSFKQFKTFHEQTEKRAYDEALKALEKKALSAVEDGDVEAYSEIKKQQEELEPPKIEVEKPVGNKDFDNWVADNKWYLDDRELHILADGYGQLLSEQGYSGRALFDEVSKKVMNRAPDKFGKKGGFVSVETGGPTPKSGGKTFSDLPQDAQQQCNIWVKDGLLTKEQYLKDYIWE